MTRPPRVRRSRKRETPRAASGHAACAIMSSIVERIKDIEKEISRTQINKATMSHLCSLRARLAKLRTELLTPAKSGGGGEGFDVEKVGDARVALIGFPSVGKSTILSTFTTSKSEAAAYEFQSDGIVGIYVFSSSELERIFSSL